MRKTIIALALVSVALPGAAVAADYEGPYAALSGGIGIVKFDGSILSGPVDDVSNSAVVGGVLGFRTPLGRDGRIVLGLEGDVDFYTSGSSVRIGGYGIAGFRVGDDNLIYGRVGYAKLSSYSNSFLTDSSLDGLVFGGGYEHSLNDSLSLRIDYRFLNYGDTAEVDNTVNYSGHEIKAALVLEF